MDFPGLVVTGKEACAYALRRPELSSNPGGPMTDSANLLFMDGEPHRRLRAVVREIVADLEPLPQAVLDRIQGIVAGLHDRDEIDPRSGPSPSPGCWSPSPAPVSPDGGWPG